MAVSPQPESGSAPFEVVGDLPESVRLDDLVAFAGRLKAAPWGGGGYERLVVANASKGLRADMSQSLRVWMKPSEYQEWQRGHEGGRIGATGAKTFIAHDGLRTAAVLPLPDRWDFLMFACHEMVEAALDRRHEQEGHEFREMTHTSLAHVLWTEYAVERTRRTIATDLGWGFGGIENGHIVEQMQEIEAELPSLIRWAVEHDEPPQRIFQHWYEMARVYAMTLGRADVDCPADEEQLRRFRSLPLVLESMAGWNALDAALRAAYGCPEEEAAALDQFVRNDGWIPLYEEMTEFWNKRYEAALS